MNVINCEPLSESPKSRCSYASKLWGNVDSAGEI